MMWHSAKALFAKSLAKLSRFTEKGEEAVLCLGIVILAGLTIVNVVARVALHSINGAEEMSRFLVILITFTGLSYAVRRVRHIRMAALFDLMPKKIKKVLIFVLSLLSSSVMFFMAYQALIYTLTSQGLQQRSPCLLWPIWIFIAIVPVGFCFGGIHYLQTVIKNILEKEVWLSPEHQDEYEDEGS